MYSNGKKHVFSAEEKKTFKDILKRYSSVVELKDTDGETLKAKKHAWESIAKEYNTSPYCRTKVTNTQLRRLWLNLRQRERQKESLMCPKQHQNGIGTPRELSTLSDPLRNPDIADEAQTLMVGIDEDQLHELEMQVMIERLQEAKAKTREAEAKAREAEAKAELAELVLAQHRLSLDNTISED